MKRFAYLFAAILALLAALGAGDIALAAPARATVTVDAGDFEFQPRTITISVGDTVTWTNTGSAPHTITAADKSWDSGNLNAGQSFSHTFDVAGTFDYYCLYHGSAAGAGMAGTIVVKAAGAAPETTAPAATEVEGSGVMPSIEVGDQSTGATLTAAKVVAAQDGWLVVHANSAENKPGPVLGQTAVQSGENRDVQVALNPAAAPGDRLWPMLHIDAGTMGSYEFPGPDAPVIVEGAIVMKQVSVAAAALPETGRRDSSPLYLYLGGAAALIIVGSFTLRRVLQRSR